MKNFLKSLIVGRLRRKLEEPIPEAGSSYRLAKSFYLFRLRTLQAGRDGLLITMGILSAGLGLEGFLLPNGFIDGGVTGISLLVATTGALPLPALIILINLPFLILAYRQIGQLFALKSALAIGGLAVALIVVPYSTITNDDLLVATFGGFFLGAGIGLAVRGGAVLDGTEVLAIFISRKTGLTIGDVILTFNIVIFSAAAYLLRIETALYAMLTYLAASKTVDFIIEGVEEYIGVTIVSSHYEEIRMFIVEKMNRGTTIYSGLRGHGKRGEMHHTEIIFTVITRLEMARLKNAVEQIDPQAFVAMHSVRDTFGGIIKRRAWKEH
jgi:uncharacterized membrane-anchored protein YitT (DUF2179 family)